MNEVLLTRDRNIDDLPVETLAGVLVASTLALAAVCNAAIVRPGLRRLAHQAQGR
ncbi:hypothetical protein PV646_20100 [Streptomyces sp. ID05-26A]|nr:hypothetical protein [Streptomyces sp. ID05-26A]